MTQRVARGESDLPHASLLIGFLGLSANASTVDPNPILLRVLMANCSPREVIVMLREFTIKVDCGEYALSINPSNPTSGSQLILQSYSPLSKEQRWQFLYDPATEGAIIYNSYFNMIVVPGDESKVFIETYEPSTVNPGKVWQICGMNNAAIRLQNNNDLNLNASGGCSNDTPIIVYKWAGDKSNMQWTSALQTAPPTS